MWTQGAAGNTWQKSVLNVFDDTVWRVSWSPSGNVLAVSCGDTKVTLWKEDSEGVYQMIGDVTESYQ